PLHLVIAAHDVGTADENFTIFGNPHLLAADNAANRTETCDTWSVQSNHRRGLGQSIAFVDRESNHPKEFCNFFLQGSAPGDEKPDTPAEPLPDCSKDQIIRDSGGHRFPGTLHASSTD